MPVDSTRLMPRQSHSDDMKRWPYTLVDARSFGVTENSQPVPLGPTLRVSMLRLRYLLLEHSAGVIELLDVVFHPLHLWLLFYMSIRIYILYPNHPLTTFALLVLSPMIHSENLY